MIFMCALQWFESVAANMLIKPYELGVWTFGGGELDFFGL